MIKPILIMSRLSSNTTFSGFTKKIIMNGFYFQRTMEYIFGNWSYRAFGPGPKALYPGIINLFLNYKGVVLHF